MINTYTITTDDASYAKAVITILNCLQADDVVEREDIEAIIFLMEMLFSLPTYEIDRESLLCHARILEKIAADLVVQANKEIEP